MDQIDFSLDELAQMNNRSRKRRINNRNQYHSNYYSTSKRRRYDNYNGHYRHHSRYYNNNTKYNNNRNNNYYRVSNNNYSNKETKQDENENEQEQDDDILYEHLGYNHSNNYGWRQGWSLEQEFKKQSLKINVDIKHKQYLTKRCIANNDYPTQKYRRRKGEDKKHIIHWGQRKLLLSEIEFLNLYLSKMKPHKDGYKHIYYAGAAPGKHIPLLIDMYPDIIMSLYDPNDFCYKCKNNDRIKVYQQYFTDKIAENIGKLGRDILFISDIRTADHRRQTSVECEESIIKDNMLQSNWVKALASNCNLIASMVKFRCPYPHLIKQQEHISLDGRIYLQCYAPVTSTETRLHVIPDKNGKIKERKYNTKQYEEQLFWFNTTCRQSIVDNCKYYKPEIGVINNYDCYAECKILEEYYKCYKNVENVQKMDVIKLVNKITKFIGSQRCLLTKPADVHEQKKGLGMVNHCNFHKNQQIANPEKVASDAHYLYGYEGVLGIDPNDKPKLNKLIMDKFKENGYDTNKIAYFDQMINLYWKSDENDVNEFMVIPSFNRPLYHMICIENQILFIPLKGFSSMWFKIDSNYTPFYKTVFGDKFKDFCCLTGYLIDNHKTKNFASTLRYTFMIIDILKKTDDDNNIQSIYDYNERRKDIEQIVGNYENNKHTVTEKDIFKFIPIKMELIPCFNGETAIKSFKTMQVKRLNVVKSNMNNNKNMNKCGKLKWNDIQFDIKEYESPPKGFYFRKIALNSQIGGCIWIKNDSKNLMISCAHYEAF